MNIPLRYSPLSPHPFPLPPPSPLPIPPPLPFPLLPFSLPPPHTHTHKRTHKVLSQGTGAFTIGGQIYPSYNQQYDALYVYDQTRGSPAPFNFTCTSTQGALLDVRTTNELISLQSLIGSRGVDNVTITGTSSTLNFDPEFLPQFSGIYKCAGDSVQEAVMITTGTK